VIALLAGVQDAVAAEFRVFELAGGITAVADLVVAVVALLARVQGAVAAVSRVLQLTGGVTAVAVGGVAVVAFLTAVQNAVTARGHGLIFTSGAAAVAFGGIAVIALLRAGLLAVTANGSVGGEIRIRSRLQLKARVEFRGIALAVAKNGGNMLSDLGQARGGDHDAELAVGVLRDLCRGDERIAFAVRIGLVVFLRLLGGIGGVTGIGDVNFNINITGHVGGRLSTEQESRGTARLQGHHLDVGGQRHQLVGTVLAGGGEGHAVAQDVDAESGIQSNLVMADFIAGA